MPQQDVDRLDLSRPPPRRQVLITTYDLAQKLRGYERHVGMLICDESHALKNRRAAGCPTCPLCLPHIDAGESQNKKYRSSDHDRYSRIT